MNGQRPSGRLRTALKYLTVLVIGGLLGAWGMRLYRGAERKSGDIEEEQRFVEDFYRLPEVGDPSVVSPYWSVVSTPRFEAAPIRIVVYADFRCPDYLFFYRQIQELEPEFAGKMNVAVQFFPLEATCNGVVEKDLHPGACELAWIAAYDPEQFRSIHEEIMTNFSSGRSPEWRRELAARHGISAALTDPAVRETVGRIIATGAEYARTSERFSHGIRSTPTLILNGRMIIGTFPTGQLRSLFRALVEGQERGHQKFLENWERR
jgi:protein-disulfide isomerase